MERLNWDKNKQWIIRRAFEYGNEEEIHETIRFYGKECVCEILAIINDERKAEVRNANIEKYLNIES